MNPRSLIVNGILWAAAILAAAFVHAPVILTTVILPALAIGALTLSEALPTAPACRE